jgi:hypothetical protein
VPGRTIHPGRQQLSHASWHTLDSQASLKCACTAGAAGCPVHPGSAEGVGTWQSFFKQSAYDRQNTAALLPMTLAPLMRGPPTALATAISSVSISPAVVDAAHALEATCPAVHGHCACCGGQEALACLPPVGRPSCMICPDKSAQCPVFNPRRWLRPWAY